MVVVWEREGWRRRHGEGRYMYSPDWLLNVCHQVVTGQELPCTWGEPANQHLVLTLQVLCTCCPLTHIVHWLIERAPTNNHRERIWSFSMNLDRPGLYQ